MAVTPPPVIPPPLLDDYAGQPVGFQIPPPIIQPVDVGAVPVEALPADVAAPPPVPGQPLPPPRIDAPDLYAGMPERLPPPGGFVPPTPAEGQPDAAQAAAGRVSQGLLGYADSLIPRQPTPAVPAPAGQAPASAQPGEQPQPMDPATRYQVDVARARAEQAAADEDAVLAAGLAQQRLQEQRRVRQEQYDQSRQEAQEYVDAELQRLSDRATEPLLDGKSKIALAVAAGLKALASGLSGGRVGNDAVELINRTLRQRAEERARQDQLARERVAARRQEVMDVDQQQAQYFQQVELDMAATQANLAQQIRENAARFGSAEAQANAETLAGRLDMEAAARAAKVAEERGQQLFENRVTMSKVEQDRLALEQRERESQRQAALTRRAQNIGASQFDRKMALEIEQLRAQGDEKAAAAKQKELETARKEGVYGPDSQILLNKDGTPFLAGTEGRASELRGQVANVGKTADLVDELIRLRNIHGWSSNLFRSPEFQQMKSNWANLQLTEKDVRTLGAITGSDLELMNNLFGGAADPTEMRDPTPGLIQYRKNAQAGLNKELRANGYSGPPVEFSKKFGREQGGDLAYSPNTRNLVEGQLLDRDSRAAASSLTSYMTRALQPDTPEQETRMILGIVSDLATRKDISKDERRKFQKAEEILREQTGIRAPARGPAEQQTLDDIAREREERRKVR